MQWKRWIKGCNVRIELKVKVIRNKNQVRNCKWWEIQMKTTLRRLKGNISIIRLLIINLLRDLVQMWISTIRLVNMKRNLSSKHLKGNSMIWRMQRQRRRCPNKEVKLVI